MATSLEAISPVDGRYSKTTAAFIPYFSEYALFRYRLIIEIEYLIELSHPGFPCEGLFTVTDVDPLVTTVTVPTYPVAYVCPAPDRVREADVSPALYPLATGCSSLVRSFMSVLTSWLTCVGS